MNDEPPSSVVTAPLRALVALLITLGSSAYCQAQTIPIDQLVAMPMRQLMQLQVFTPSRQEERLAEAPTHTVVISRRQIRERGYHNLLDLLEDQPGFLVQRANAPGARFNTISWRGLRDTPHFQLMLDGIRVDSPTGEPFSIDDNFPLNHARQVEIIFGPASALYGSDAAAGVINIISKQPPDHATANLQAERGSFGNQAITFDGHLPLGDHAALTLSGNAQQADTADLSRYYPQTFAPVDAKTFGGTVAVPAAGRQPYRAPIRNHSLYARLRIGHHLKLMAHRAYNRHSTSIGYKLSDALYRDPAHWSTELTTLAATHRWALGGNLSLRSEIHGHQHTVLPDSAFQNIYTDFNTYYKYARSRGIGIDEQLRWQQRQQTVAVGLTFDALHSIPKTADLPRRYNSALAPSAQGMVYANTTLPLRFFEVRYRTFGLSAQLKSRWSRALSTTVGLRYDHDSRFGGSINPRLSLVYQSRQAIVNKLLYAEALRSPSTMDMFENFGSFSGATDANGRYTSSFFHIPNPALRPEKVRDIEWELTAPLTDNGQGSLSLFHYWVQNLILTQRGGSNTTFIPGSAISSTETNANIGSSRHYGIELSLRWQHRFAGGGRLKLWGNYSYLHGRIRQPASIGMDLPYTTAQQGRLGLTFDDGAWLTITPRLRLIGRSNSPKADNARPGHRLQAPGYGVVDLHLASHPWRHLRATLDIRNLFDRRYSHAGGLAAASLTRVPQPPRALLATVEISL